MRDVNRIDRITDKINKLWHRNPDMRFWQIISLLNVPEDKVKTDPFFWEDDLWELMFEEAAKQPSPYTV